MSSRDMTRLGRRKTYRANKVELRATNRRWRLSHSAAMQNYWPLNTAHWPLFLDFPSSAKDNKRFFCHCWEFIRSFVASASSSAPVLAHGVAPLRAGQGTSFVLRRLHSLTGIIPVGAFLFEHILISNSTAIGAMARRPMPARSVFWRISRWYSSWNCSGSGCPSRTTRSTASTSGTAVRRIRFPIPGQATGCTRCSAGPAASPLSTSPGTRTRCDLRVQTCICIRDLSFGKVQAEVFQIPTVPVLCGRTHRGFVALCLWHLAVLAKWGIVSGEKAQKRLLASAWHSFSS